VVHISCKVKELSKWIANKIGIENNSK
jgi:hypothetical protein